jgi:hypothetical protein
VEPQSGKVRKAFAILVTKLESECIFGYLFKDGNETFGLMRDEKFIGQRKECRCQDMNDSFP